MVKLYRIRTVVDCFLISVAIFPRIISTTLNYLATMSFDAEFHFASTIVCLIDSRPPHLCERIRNCLARVRETYSMKLHQMSMLK